VRAVQHVFRRGAVYWWRRRLLKKTGERELAPIAISLRTRDLSRARTIAAHLAVASDGILRQPEGSEVLSPVQVRSMLESVARSHLAKLDRLAVLETADGITADEGRTSDRVMGWARRLQASQGIGAVVGDAERGVLAANGLSSSCRNALQFCEAAKANPEEPLRLRRKPWRGGIVDRRESHHSCGASRGRRFAKPIKPAKAEMLMRASIRSMTNFQRKAPECGQGPLHE
jgi:hypothetical protein